MHSADYAIARCLSVRLSVCHTPVLYPQFFFVVGSHAILLFLRQTVWQYADENT